MNWLVLLPFGGGFAFVYNPQDEGCERKEWDPDRRCGKDCPLSQSDRNGDDVEADHGDAKK